MPQERAQAEGLTLPWLAAPVVVLLVVVAVPVVLLVMLKRAVTEGAEAVARACSLQPDELYAQLHDGADLRTVARRYGVDADAVVRDALAHSKRRWLAAAATRSRIPPDDPPPAA